MCGRYRRTTAEEEIARQYHIPIPPQLDLPISYNIAPSQNILAIRKDSQTGDHKFDVFRWGLIPNWSKDERIAYETINARVETIDTAPAYRAAFRKHRCLIPADGYPGASAKEGTPLLRTPAQKSSLDQRRRNTPPAFESSLLYRFQKRHPPFHRRTRKSIFIGI
jgi:putative SOS response-associated peptidase YedK